MKKEFQMCQESQKSPFVPLFQRGKFIIFCLNQFKKALLPLEKGGREGFLGKPSQMAKQLGAIEAARGDSWIAPEL